MKRRVYKFFENGGPAVKRPKKIDPSQPGCLLLALPGELRNRIYDYSLLEEEIRVTRGTKPPSLSSVCRRIREETQPIWFSDNIFVFEINNCDASLVRSFRKQGMVSLHIPSLRLKFRDNMRFIMWTDSSNISWDNLERWCHAIQQGELEGVAVGDEDSTDAEVVMRAAFDLARIGQNVTWEYCKDQLSRLRTVAGRLEPNWLV